MSFNKTVRAIGVFLIVGSVFGLYSWVNESDPDCYYTTGVALQARLCGEAYVGDAELPNIAVVVICLAMMLVGFILVKFYSDKIQLNDLSDKDEISH